MDVHMTGSYHSVCVCDCVCVSPSLLTIQIFFFLSQAHKNYITTTLVISIWGICDERLLIHSAESWLCPLQCTDISQVWPSLCILTWRFTEGVMDVSLPCFMEMQAMLAAGTKNGGRHQVWRVFFFFSPSCLYFVPLLEASWCQSHLNQMKTWIFHIN